jgi:hypothetical protein
MIRTALSATVAALALFAPTGWAQKLDTAKLVEPGDKVVSNWVLNNKSQHVEEEYSAAQGGGVEGVQRAGGKEFRLVLPGVGQVSEGICLANGQRCTFTPAVPLVEFPLEKGRKWNAQYTVKGETFTADLAAERKVDKIEKVKVPAGEFEAYRISHSARIKGTDAKGNVFSGKEDSREWYAVVNGKLLLVKVDYRNSFGEKFVREVVSVALK